MAIVSLNTIKNWFKTSLKPTQEQFWDAWDSFRHKSDTVLVVDIEGLDELLLEKASKSALEATVEELHSFMITPYTTFKFLHKGYGNTNLTINEIGDIFCGWSNDGIYRIHEAQYLGGVLTDSNNFKPLIQTEI